MEAILGLVVAGGLAVVAAIGHYNSPREGRACALYHAKVQQYGRQRIDESLYCPELWLVDNSGRALVQLIAPAMRLTMDARWSSGALDDPTAEQRAFVERHQQTTYDDTLVGHFNKDLTYHEGALEAGEEIVVFGLCKMEIDPEPRPDGDLGYRESPMRARIVDPPGGRMLISDEPSVLAAAQASSRERER